MFYENKEFNQAINTWDVSKVTSFESFLGNASSFNQPLESLVGSNVVNVRRMLDGADSFSHPVDSWDISNVEHINRFLDSKAFLDKYNDGNSLPYLDKNTIKWFESYKEKTMINNLEERTLDDFLKDNNIDPKSEIGKTLIKNYYVGNVVKDIEEINLLNPRQTFAEQIKILGDNHKGILNEQTLNAITQYNYVQESFVLLNRHVSDPVQLKEINNTLKSLEKSMYNNLKTGLPDEIVKYINNPNIDISTNVQKIDEVDNNNEDFLINR